MKCKYCNNNGYWFEKNKFGYYTIYCVECSSDWETKPDKDIIKIDNLIGDNK